MPKIVVVARKRREILTAATAVFVRYGYRGTNLQRVADRLGMGKSSLYHYFPTKEALFTALADAVLRQEADLFESLGASTLSAPERLHRLIEAITGLFGEWTKAGPLLVDFLREPRGRRRIQDTFRRARGALAGLIADGQRAGLFRAGPPAALATIVLACLDGLFLQELVEHRSTQEAAGGTLLPELLLAALRSREER